MASHDGVPRSTFAKLSPSAYLLSSLSSESPTRANSRRPSEARPPLVNAGSLTHANGSALVRVGDTTALCGVRAETLRATDIPAYRPDRIAFDGRDRGPAELLDYDLLVPNIELATGSAPQFLPGGPPSTLAQTLSSRVYSLLHSSRLLDVEELRIWHARPGETAGNGDGGDDDAMEEDDKQDALEANKEVVAFWVLYIDIFFVSYDGNPFDVAWTALIAALRDTKLPQVRWDPDREKVLVLPGDLPRRRLTIRGLPLACTAGVFAARPPAAEDVLRPPPRDRAWVLLDPDRAEEELCEESVTAVVDCSGGDGETRVLSLSKHGGLGMGPELVREYVDVAATRRWGEFAEALRRGARD